MRKSTLLWLALATCCGTALFHTSQKVHDEREKLAQLETAITKEEESLRVLNAEWGYLNQPERLEKLARTYLKLAPLKGSQFTKLEDIPMRAAAPPPAATSAVAVEETPPHAEKPVAAKKPAVAAIITPVKIRKPAPAPHKTAPTQAAATAANGGDTRSFSDLMKSLRTGVE